MQNHQSIQGLHAILQESISIRAPHHSNQHVLFGVVNYGQSVTWVVGEGWSENVGKVILVNPR